MTSAIFATHSASHDFPLKVNWQTSPIIINSSDGAESKLERPDQTGATDRLITARMQYSSHWHS